MGLLGGIFPQVWRQLASFPPLGRPVSWAGLLPPGPISPLSQNDERGEKEEAGDGEDEDENDGAVDGKEEERFFLAVQY